MPKKQIDYSKMVIYKLQHREDETLLYIGSTTDFTQRKRHHKSVCYNQNSKEFNQKKYQMIRDNGGWDMFNMIQIEEYPCDNKRQAEKREDELIKELKSNMNMKKAHCGFETKQEYDKQYRIEHIEHVKERKKQYYNDNKETIKQKMNCYKINNETQIRERSKVKVICECGCLIRKHDINRHRKTKKHIQLMEQV